MKFEQETQKFIILEAILKISKCKICFMRAGKILHKKMWNKKKLNLLKVLCRNTQYSHSWLHRLLNRKRDFRLKPGTCNMNPQSINIGWLEGTPCDNWEKRYTRLIAWNNSQTGQLNTLKAPVIKQKFF